MIFAIVLLLLLGLSVLMNFSQLAGSVMHVRGGGSAQIETFSYLTVVQVINQGYCAVNNPGYQGAAPWNSLCAVPPSPGAHSDLGAGGLRRGDRG